MNKINYPSKTSEFKALKKEYQSCILNSSKIDLTEIQNFLTSIGVKESFENILVLPLDELIQITPLSATNVFLGLTDTQIKDRKRNIASYFKYVQFQQRELSIFFNSYISACVKKFFLFIFLLSPLSEILIFSDNFL